MRKRYQSTKLFSNYTVALRQWKAQHSHCQLLHGYAFQFKIWFESVEPDLDKQLDEMNWIVDFGGFKEKPVGNGLKEWMDDMFDHTMLIQNDDPYRDLFEQMGVMGIAKVHFVEKMGCESLAKMVFDKFNDVLSKTDGSRCRVVKVECFENEKNSAIYTEE